MRKLVVIACVGVFAALGATSASGTVSAGAKKKCHPSYKGACLKIGVGDYDCGGGGGNGPNYVWKKVRVVGPDVFRLDADHDGWGCEQAAGCGVRPCSHVDERTAPPPSTCDPSYPGVCIPPPPPDLDCGDISYTNFTVLPPDPHGFDGDHDGVGCET